MDLSLWPAGGADESRAADAFNEALSAGEAMLLTSDVEAVVAALTAAKAAGGRRMDIVVDNAGFELVRLIDSFRLVSCLCHLPACV